MKTLKKRDELKLAHTNKTFTGTRVIRVTDAEAPAYIADGWIPTSKKTFKKARFSYDDRQGKFKPIKK